MEIALLMIYNTQYFNIIQYYNSIILYYHDTVIMYA